MTSVALRSKRQRKAKVLQKLNHVVPALGLLSAGQQAIAQGHEGFGFYLGVFEIVSSVALIVLFGRELKAALRPSRQAKAPAAAHGHAHSGHGVDWVDIAAGFVLVAELLEHWHLTHHVRRPILFSTITTFALGLFHGRLAAWGERRRALTVSDEGITIGGRPLKVRKLQASWADVQSIDVGPRWAVVTTRGGRVRRLDLPDLATETEVRAALLRAQQLTAAHRAGA